MSGAADFSDEQLAAETLRRGVGYSVPDPALGGLDEDLSLLRLAARTDRPDVAELRVGARQLARAIEVLTGKSLPEPDRDTR